jgi:hypothetical protein
MNVEDEIRKIQARNARVELDKKWETSWTRRLLICALTFAVVLIYNLLVAARANVVLNSVVPVIGFFLSVQGLDAARKIWEGKIKK